MKTVRFASRPTTPSPSPSSGSSRPSLPPQLEERTHHRAAGYRIAADLVRYHQIGVARAGSSSTASAPRSARDTWVSTRDHSWGVRYDVGAPPTDVEPGDRLDGWSFLHVWSPVLHGAARRQPLRPVPARGPRVGAGLPAAHDHRRWSSTPTAPSSTSTTSSPTSRYDPVNRRLQGGRLDAHHGRRLAPPAAGRGPLRHRLPPRRRPLLRLQRPPPRRMAGRRSSSRASASPTAPTAENARRLHQIRDTVVRVTDPVGGGVGVGNCSPSSSGAFPHLGLDAESSFM